MFTKGLHDLDLSPFKGWLDEERIVVNVNTLYKDFGASSGLLSRFELRTWMGRYRRERRERPQDQGHTGHSHTHGH